MKIDITKKQEIVNDEAGVIEYSINVTQTFGTGDYKRDTRQYLWRLSLEDVEALRDRLNKDFPNER